MTWVLVIIINTATHLLYAISHLLAIFQKRHFSHFHHFGESYHVVVVTLHAQDNHCSSADLHTPGNQSSWRTIEHFGLHGPQPSHQHFAEIILHKYFITYLILPKR